MTDAPTPLSAVDAAHTLCPLALPPLASYQHNRVAQIFDSLRLSSMSDAEADAIFHALTAAYHVGWRDSHRTLSDLDHQT